MFTKYAVALLIATPMFAGGFWLEMGTADANPEAKAINAALIVRAVGCHDPATAEVSGVALRVIDGRRQTTPLRLSRLKQPGTFAVLREWPAGTTVTLEFIGRSAGVSTSMLVHARGDAIEKGSAKFYSHEPTPEEEMASLAR
jgi:hypothetical protein